LKNTTSFGRQGKRILALAAVAVLVMVALMGWALSVIGIAPVWMLKVVDLFSAFTAVFMGIFIEAAPYLLLGTLASGAVEVFLDSEAFMRLIPRAGLPGALAGSLLGLFFPVCECGVVPLTRRLMRKGLPVPAGIAFLLAAPVLNPIVIASTLAAFGAGLVFWGRLGVTLVAAVVTGWVFSLQPGVEQVLRAPMLPRPVQPSVQPRLAVRIRQVLVIAGDEFFEMGRYLVIGASLAAFLQTVIPQSALLAVGRGPFLSVAVMVLLAVLLSVCSTVDAFIALAFASTFTTGSILAFLVYGPMVDIKSTLMYLKVFRRRTVVTLVLLPLLITLAAGTALNVFAAR
jgi:uncharacterized protein